MPKIDSNKQISDLIFNLIKNSGQLASSLPSPVGVGSRLGEQIPQETSAMGVGNNLPKSFQESKQKDILHEAAMAEASKIRKEEVRAAHQANVPLEQIISMSDEFAKNNIAAGVRNFGQIPVNNPNVSSTPAPQDVYAGAVSDIAQSTQNKKTSIQSNEAIGQDYNYKNPNTAMSILGALFPAIGLQGAFNQKVEGMFLDNAGKRQKLQGKEPLQDRDRELEEMKSMNKFFESSSGGSTKPLSAEAGKLLGNVNSGLAQLNTFDQALEENSNIFKEWRSPRNSTGQALKFMNEDLIDILGRFRSGGAINAEEFNSFKKQLPKIGSFMNFENSKTAKLKIQKLKSLFNDIKTSVEPKSEQMSGKIQGLLQRGATREQIYNVYKKGGFQNAN